MEEEEREKVEKEERVKKERVEKERMEREEKEKGGKERIKDLVETQENSLQFQPNVPPIHAQHLTMSTYSINTRR